MKKSILVAAALLMAALGANAQNGYDSKHEVALGYGVYSNTQMLDAFTVYATTEAGATFSNEKYSGMVVGEYLYRVNRWLGVGCDFVYGSSSMDFSTVAGVDKEGHTTSRYFTLMPAVKFDWLRTKFVGLYSKLALGATVCNWKNEYVDGRDDATDNVFLFNFQASLLGVEAGGPHFRVFLEGGMGEQGVVTFGLRYKI